MTVKKYDVSNVEAGMDFDIPFPAGVYSMEIEEIEFTESKKSGDDMLKITLAVTKGPHKGRKVWEYIVLSGSQDFRLRNLVDALGTKDGAADIDYNPKTKLVKSIGKVKVGGFDLVANIKIEGSKDDDFGEQNKVKSFLVGEAAEGAVEEAEEEEEVEEPEAEEEEDNGESDEWTYDDLAGMDRDELKAWKKENEADTKITKGKSDEDIARELAEEFGLEGIPEEEEQEEEEEEEEEETEDAPDYDSMSLKELKEAAEEKGIEPKGTKKALIKKLNKADKEGGAKKSGGDPF